MNVEGTSFGFRGFDADLFTGVSALDEAAVCRALEAGANPNARNVADDTITSLALKWVSRDDRFPPILRHLLRAGADISIPHLGSNLGSAAGSDSVAVIEIVAEGNPNWNVPLDYRFDGQIVTILDEIDETIELMSRGQEDVKGPKRDLERTKLVREALVRFGAIRWRDVQKDKIGEPGATDNPDGA